MSNNKQKLELIWIGKGEQPKLEPRILIEDPTKSYGDKNAENMLIYGDNLLALKALEQDYAGKIKCIYIDPPYNTGSAFEHYDDGLEHSIWLSLIKPRLEILKSLLTQNGSIWISVDDNESHYLKVLCDEIFGRQNFVANVVWEKVYTPKSNGRGLSADHDHILVYAKSDNWFDSGWNLIPRNEEQNNRFTNVDNDPKGPWRTYPLDVRTEDGAKREKYRYEVKLPSGRIVKPSPGRHWVLPKDKFETEQKLGLIYFGKNGDAMPTKKVYLKDARKGVIARTWWSYSDVSGNQDAKREILALFGDSGFITPKPEKLIQRIITIATNEGDWVLDSFLGSGTTVAVAHKMKRKWIGIELGEHCDTHCLPRLEKVCNGTDQGGISGSVNWAGGGGFKYYYLAPSLLLQDNKGNWVINKEYNAIQLAAAMAKHEGFRFQPDDNQYWKQGESTEKDFIFTTTNFVSVEFIDSIRGEMNRDESLLICCPSFSKAADKYPNITIKKIPKMLLGKCEFGKEDYSLNIINMPRESDEPDFIPTGPIASNKPTDKKKKGDTTEDLFSSAKGGKK
jgi:adenine-specific DNA-methyltransferase